jgi:hypothetical protein
VTETVLLANSKLMDSVPMSDLVGTFYPSGKPGCEDSGVKVFASLLQVTVPPFGVMVTKPDVAPSGGIRITSGSGSGLQVMALRPIYLCADMWQSPGLKPPCRGMDVDRT